MKQEYRYAALHVRTGDSTEGTAKEVAKFVGCTPATIRNYGLMKEKLYQKTWKIEMLSTSQTEYDDCNSLTEEDLKKWDDFMKSVKKKSKKKVRLRKPQEVRMESGKFFGEVLETGYYTEGNTAFEVEEDLAKHDV